LISKEKRLFITSDLLFFAEKNKSRTQAVARAAGRKIVDTNLGFFLAL